MKKMLTLILFIPIILIGCSSQSDESKAEYDRADMGTEEKSVEPIKSSLDDISAFEKEKSVDNGNNGNSEEESQTVDPDHQQRMVMYNAELTIEVKDIPKALDFITNQTNSLKGYIVESSTSNHEEETYGYMTVRIPSEKLQPFMDHLEGNSEGITNKSVYGTDVTEEYTDLQSRLIAKRVVEERLLSFMKEAEKTEDLLKISEDLAKVQKEIEQLEGRKRYLDNRVDYASITISLIDVSVKVPNVQEKDLQTGNKIKQAFVNSINMLTEVGSWLIIFFIGYSPILIILVLTFTGIFIYRKKKKKE